VNNTLSEAGIASLTHDHAGVYQPLDGDLNAIAALSDSSVGFLKKTATNS
jgi:hypothetical protein